MITYYSDTPTDTCPPPFTDGESDHAPLPDYVIKDGVYWSVDGWETEPDEDTEWTGILTRTGLVVIHMVGDDHQMAVERADLGEPVADDAIVCSHGTDCGWCGYLHGEDEDDE